MNNLIEIGKRIKLVRESRNMSQKMLADKIGKTESSIAKYEKGLVNIPSTVLQNIADAFEVDIDTFYTTIKVGWGDEPATDVFLSTHERETDVRKEAFEKFDLLNLTGKVMTRDYINLLIKSDEYTDK